MRNQHGEALRVKLTRTAIDSLELPKVGARLVRDAELPNFGLRITAKGSKKYFIQRRINGRDRRITIGSAAVWSPETARKHARALLGKIDGGEDPIAERARKRAQAVSLAEAFADYVAARRGLKPRTISDMRIAMASIGWADRHVTSITPDMVERKHAELGEKSHARANLAMRYLRAVLNFAAEKYTDASGQPILGANPVRRLSRTRAWFRIERRRTLIKAHQLKPWMQAVMGLANEDARDFFLFVLLTGLRRGEASMLRWRDIDLRAGTLTIPDPKNRKPHTLPLPAFLQKMLERRNGAPGEFVFQTEKGRLQNLRYAMADVTRSSGVNFCIHDLRRTFATVAESLDVPAYALKAMLNHSNMADVTSGYIVHDVERLRRPMQKVADHFLLLGGLRASAKVSALPGARARNLPTVADAAS